MTLTYQTEDEARAEMALFQAQKAARLAAQPAVIRFMRNRLIAFKIACPQLFELARLLRTITDDDLHDPRDADFQQAMDREWASFSIEQRLSAWFDYLNDVKRGCATINDNRHICMPLFNRLARYPVLGAVRMHRRNTMMRLLASPVRQR